MQSRPAEICAAPQTRWTLREAVALVLFLGLLVTLHFLFADSLRALGLGTTSSLGGIFLIGLAATFSSCTAVVVGLSASLAVLKGRGVWFFNLGRLLGFAAFGALLGLVGQVLEFTPFANGLLLLALAVFMLALGVQLLGLMPRLGFLNGFSAWSRQRLERLGALQHPLAPFLLGALTFFLPCGFTQSVQLYALSSGSPLAASLMMTIFALGTLPALAGLGALGGYVQGSTKKVYTRAVAALILFLGLTTTMNGLTLLGYTGFSPRPVNASVPGFGVVENPQVVELEVSAYGYSPEVLYVIEDTPVSLELYAEEQLGCASTFVAPAFNLAEPVSPGFSTISFTPHEPGTFSFSCSMGMLRGTLVVLPKNT